jgi:hypothetical protein
MKFGSITVTLRTKCSPWNAVIRDKISRKIKKKKPGFGWEGHVECFFLESGTCCSCRILEKETTINSQR